MKKIPDFVALAFGEFAFAPGEYQNDTQSTECNRCNFGTYQDRPLLTERTPRGHPDRPLALAVAGLSHDRNSAFGAAINCLKEPDVASVVAVKQKTLPDKRCRTGKTIGKSDQRRRPGILSTAGDGASITLSKDQCFESHRKSNVRENPLFMRILASNPKTCTSLLHTSKCRSQSFSFDWNELNPSKFIQIFHC